MYPEGYAEARPRLDGMGGVVDGWGRREVRVDRNSGGSLNPTRLSSITPRPPLTKVKPHARPQMLRVLQ